jgi:hypothetical protein
MKEMMKHILLVTLALCFAGCTTRPSITEARLAPFYESADGDLSEVQGKVLSIRDYSDMAERTDSLATFPHLYLEVQLTKGELPGYPKAKVFDCHLGLDRKGVYTVDDTILLLFDEKGNLESTGILLGRKRHPTTKSTLSSECAPSNER